MPRHLAILAADGHRLELAGRARGGIAWEAGIDRSVESLSQFGADALDRRAPGLAEEAVVGWTRAWGQATARVGPATLSGGLVWDTPHEGRAPGLGFLPNGMVRVGVGEHLTLEAARGMGRQFTYPFAPAGRSFGPSLGVDHVWMIAGDGSIVVILCHRGELSIVPRAGWAAEGH